MSAAFFQLQIFGESRTRDNAVDMRLGILSLPPDVQDLDDAGGGTEESGISGAFQEGRFLKADTVVGRIMRKAGFFLFCREGGGKRYI